MKKKLLLFRMIAIVAALSCALGASADDAARGDRSYADFYADGMYFKINDDINGHPEYSVRIAQRPDGQKYSGYITVPKNVYAQDTIWMVTAVDVSAFEDCTDLLEVVLIQGNMMDIFPNAFKNCTSLTHMNIPYGVTYISGCAFQGCTSLQILQFPEETLTTINPGAFMGCTRLEYVDLPNSITKIEPQVFEDCTALTTVNFPDSLTSIGLSAFRNCSSLRSAEFPETLTEIGDSAFINCTGMTELVIPTSVKTIGNRAFMNCTGLQDISLNLIHRLSSIGNRAFMNCTGLQSLSVDAETIGNRAFMNCTSLQSLSLKVGSIDHSAFMNCSGLTSLELPGIEIIQDSVFQGCSNLRSVWIDDGTLWIRSNAFKGCSQLESLRLPRSVLSIYEGAFDKCLNLTDVTCEAVRPPDTYEDAPFYHTIGVTITVKVPSGFLAAYEDNEYWQPFNLEELPFSFTKDGIYYRITSENSVEATRNYYHPDGYSGDLTFPEGFSDDYYNTEDYAFETHDYTLTSIAPHAFKECNGLSSVTIPNTVDIIGYSAFQDCLGLTSVTIGSSVDTIGNYAFIGCPALTTVTSLAFTPPILMANQVFGNATYNTALLVVPADCDAAYQAADGWNLFTYNQAAPYSFEVDGMYYHITGTNTNPKTVEFACRDFSYDCYSGDVVIPISVEYGGKTYQVTGIGEKAFYDCEDLTSVEIPASVDSIAASAFSRCNALRTVNCLAAIPPKMAAYDIFHQMTLDQGTLKVSKGSKDLYETTDGWESFDNVETFNFDFCHATGTGYHRYFLITSDSTVAMSYKTPEGNCYKGRVDIPLYAEDPYYEDSRSEHRYDVTAIADSAFIDCPGLTELRFTRDDMVPTNGVRTIGAYAFKGCSGLTKVEIPNTVTYIGSYAFPSPSLEEVTCRAEIPPVLPDSTVFHSGYNANTQYYFFTPKLKVPYGYADVYSSADVWSHFGSHIGQSGYSFVEKYHYTDIYYAITSDSTVAVANKGIGNTYHNSVTIPETVTHNGKTYTVTGISDRAFVACYYLTQLTLPNTITEIGESAFWSCESLESIELPKSLVTIGDDAFGNCSALTNVTIPNLVTTIGEEAFNLCPALTSVTIGQAVTSIGKKAFCFCPQLMNVTSLALTPPVLADSVFLDDTYTSGKLWIPYATNGLYKVAYGWKNFNYSYKVTVLDWSFERDGLYYIVTSDNTVKLTWWASGNNASYWGDVVIPESTVCGYNTYTVTEIGNRTFRVCPNLTSVTIPSTVTSIGNLAFYKCTSLKSIEIPNSVNFIDNNAFEGSGLKSFVVPPLVTSLSNYILNDCDSLTSVVMHNGVTRIGKGSFAGCTSLPSLDIPDAVNYIDSYAFSYCTSLTSLTIPPLVTVINSYVFRGCTGLTSMTIPNTVTNIATYAFADCSGLTSMTIPNSVTKIGAMAFENCIGLTSVDIGTGVNTIERLTFRGCTALTSVTCQGTTPPTMKNVNVFDDNTYTTCTLFVPEESIETYQTTEWWSSFATIQPIGSAVMTGDVSGDGKVSIADVTALIDVLLTGDDVGTVADVNGDGKVSIADVTALIDYLLSGTWN